MVAIADLSDMEQLRRHRWHAARSSKKHVYAATTVTEDGKCRRIYMHRFLIGERGLVVDHINGNGLDNRRSNLRSASISENSVNRVGQGSNTGLRGVYLQAGRYLVRVGRVYGGLYESKNEAAFKANQILESFMPGFGERNPVDFVVLLTELRERRDLLNEKIGLIEAAAHAVR